MSKAEERALEYFPNKDTDSLKAKFGFLLGYHQAEKDLALTWRDIKAIDQLLWNLCEEYSAKKDNEGYFKEVLKRFNKGRKETKY